MATLGTFPQGGGAAQNAALLNANNLQGLANNAGALGGQPALFGANQGLFGANQGLFGASQPLFGSTANMGELSGISPGDPLGQETSLPQLLQIASTAGPDAAQSYLSQQSSVFENRLKGDQVGATISTSIQQTDEKGLSDDIKRVFGSFGGG